ICDMTGRIVWESNIPAIPGQAQRWTWDGKTNSGADTAMGMYCLRIRVGEQQRVVHVMRAH
ncbi:MAG: FlgD Ig-like domain, partial [Bacteroidota bacterium]